MNNTRAKIIEESQYGLYVWEMPDGRWVGDDEGHYMCIAAKKNDYAKILDLRVAAYHYFKDMGMEPVGQPKFLSGRRMVTDSEYEEQEMRARAGLVPDPYDVGAIAESLRYAKKYE